MTKWHLRYDDIWITPQTGYAVIAGQHDWACQQNKYVYIMYFCFSTFSPVHFVNNFTSLVITFFQSWKFFLDYNTSFILKALKFQGYPKGNNFMETPPTIIRYTEKFEKPRKLGSLIIWSYTCKLLLTISRPLSSPFSIPLVSVPFWGAPFSTSHVPVPFWGVVSARAGLTMSWMTSFWMTSYSKRVCPSSSYMRERGSFWNSILGWWCYILSVIDWEVLIIGM